MGSGGAIRDDVRFPVSNGAGLTKTIQGGSGELESPFSPVDGSCFLCGCLPKINDDRQGTSGYPKFGAGEHNREHSPLIFHQRLFVRARYRRGIYETTLCGGTSEQLFPLIPGAVRPRDESATIWRRGASPRFGHDVTTGSVPLERIFG